MISRRMLEGLRDIDRGRRNGPRWETAGRRMRQVWWSLRWATRVALKDYGLVELVEKTDDDGRQLNELQITQRGWGVLEGARLIEREQRRSA